MSLLFKQFKKLCVSTDAGQSLSVGCPFATGSGVEDGGFFRINAFPLVLFLSNAPDFL